MQGGLNGLFQLTASTRHRYAIGKVDAGALASYGGYLPFYRFFGLGNSIGFDQMLYNNKLYNTRYQGYTFNTFLERTFLQRSVIRVGPTFENYTSSFGSSTYPGTIETRPAHVRPNTNSQRLLGLNGVFDLDLRNRPSFAQRGVHTRVQHDSYRRFSSIQSTFGLPQGFAEYYGTAKVGVPITLVLKGGGAKNYGPGTDIPFYKFASPGQNEGLRGYYRNRFSGDASLYYNTELRLAFGRVKNGFLPFYYSVFGFYDWAGCITRMLRPAAGIRVTARASTLPRRSKRWPLPCPTRSR